MRRGNVIRICGADEPTVRSTDDCPDVELHTPSPRGYIAWHAWAERMARTHRQRRCSGCGRWAIWEPIGATT